MFSIKKLHHITSFYANENGGGNATEVPAEFGAVVKKAPIPRTRNESQQEQIDTKKGAYLDAQKKVITLGSSLETIANSKVDAVLATRLYESLPPDERRKKVQELVSEFMVQYTAEYDALATHLKGVVPPLSKEEIDIRLQDAESEAFEIFINTKRNEVREKRKEERKQRFLKTIVPTQDEEQDKKNQELVSKFEIDYTSIRTKLLEERPELSQDNALFKKEIQKVIDAAFIEYCSQNTIEIDVSLLSIDPDDATGDTESADFDSYIRIDSKGSIIQAQNEYLNAAKFLSDTSVIYQEEVEKYEKVVVLEGEENLVFDLPKKIIDLPPGESSSFLGSTGGSEIVYEATREPDGEYTLSFNGHTMKNLPKKELEVIIDLNAVPVINSIFSVSSTLYQTLLKEYKLLCMTQGSDPLENPPLGFIDFLYGRLNDAYIASLPENGDASLFGLSIAGMPFKERGKYIRNVLSTNIEIRSEVIKRLESQKILVNGKINLARYPR